eukprot:m.190064 g.190064  ORF g.190064 m.190064 type:complete len:510 (+) comp17939_c0_seq1:237-1766(+)
MWQHPGQVVIALTAVIATGCAESTDDTGLVRPNVGVFTLPDPSVAFKLDFVRPDEPGLAQRLQNEFEPDPLQLKTPHLEGYKCYVPRMHDASSDDNEEEESDGNGHGSPKAASIQELLKPLESQCIYRLEPYWSYELCWGKHVRQYHEDVITTAGGKKTKKLSEHFLGYGDPDSEAEHDVGTFNYKGKSTVYYSEIMGGGDLCDLTKKPRETEVRFVCNPSMIHAFDSISETSTCKYEVIIHTSMVCDHPDFTTEVSKKTLCVGEEGAPIMPKKLEAHMNMLVQEEKLRKAEAAEIQRVADLQHQEHLRQQQAALGGQQQQAGQQGGPQQGVPKTRLQADVGQGGGGNTVQAQPVLSAKAQKAAANQLLTRFFKGKQCFGGGQGWWQHEFCYGKHVKQIHVNPDGTRIEVVLGTWDEAHHMTKIEEAGGHKATSSMTHYYAEGDFCDEIGKHRETKVKMMCSRSLTGTQVALSLHETSTCMYTLKVQAALFCDIMKTVDKHGFPHLEKS